MNSKNRNKILTRIMMIVDIIKKEGYITTIRKCIERIISKIHRFKQWGIYIHELQSDQIHGVDFAKKVSINSLEHTLDSSMYEASRNDIYSIIASMPITPNNNFLDIGCGKGRVIYALSKLPFTKIDGIEYSSELAEIAHNNLIKMEVDNSTIYNIDAIEFKKYNEYDYFYMYNPFGERTMSEVINSIEKTLRERERERCT